MKFTFSLFSFVSTLSFKILYLSNVYHLCRWVIVCWLVWMLPLSEDQAIVCHQIHAAAHITCMPVITDLTPALIAPHKVLPMSLTIWLHFISIICLSLELSRAWNAVCSYNPPATRQGDLRPTLNNHVTWAAFAIAESVPSSEMWLAIGEC